MSTPEPDQLPEQMLISVARQIAMDLVSVDDIRKNLKIPQHTWDKILSHPSFEDYIRTFRAAWQSNENTPTRVRAKAALMLEECMPELYAIVADRKVEPTNRLKAIETIKKISDDPRNMPDAQVGTQLTINIDLGGTSTKISTVAQQPLIEGETVDADT